MKANECVTVIMNTFNEAEDYLDAAIKSIAPQVKQLIISTCEGDYNLNHIKETMPTNAMVVSLPHSRQLGKCPQQSFRQINNALPHVTGEYVCFASSNDVMLPDKYQSELNAIIKSGASICYSEYYMTDANLAGRRLIRFHKYDYMKHLQGNYVNDCSLMRTDLLREFGLLGDKWRNYAYWDMWLRIFEAKGNVFVYNPKPTWLYRQDANGMHTVRKKSPEQIEEAKRDRQAMLKSHGVSGPAH